MHWDKRGRSQRNTSPNALGQERFRCVCVCVEKRDSGVCGERRDSGVCVERGERRDSGVCVCVCAVVTLRPRYWS